MAEVLAPVELGAAEVVLASVELGAAEEDLASEELGAAEEVGAADELGAAEEVGAAEELGAAEEEASPFKDFKAGSNLEEYHGTMVNILLTPAKSTSEYKVV